MEMGRRSKGGQLVELHGMGFVRYCEECVDLFLGKA